MSAQYAAHRSKEKDHSRRTYRTRKPANDALCRLVRDNVETFFAQYDERFQPQYGYLRAEVRKALEELTACGDFHFGLARVKCRDCADELFIPLSCGRRGACNSCAAKRELIFLDRVLTDVLPEVSFRQWTFSMPKALRVFFRFDGTLFKELSQLVVAELTRYYRSVTGHDDLVAAFVVADQSFGTLPDSFHPHHHICATDGGFTPEGCFVPLPRLRKKDVAAITELLRHRVLAWLVRREKISDDFKNAMLSWAHSGFSLDASRRIRRGRRDQLKTLLKYMVRHPFDPRGIEYRPEEGTVRYRASRMHATRKTDTFEVDAVEFIAIIAQHIPHRNRHQVRFYGAAHHAVRKRLGLSGVNVDSQMPKVTAAKGRKSWARLIWKLYGVDPLVCGKCGGDRRILAIVFDRASIKRILTHLGHPTTLPAHKPARAPPGSPRVRRNARVQHSQGFESQCFDHIDAPWQDDVVTYDVNDGQEAAIVEEEKPTKSILDLMKQWPTALCTADKLAREPKPKT